MVITVLFSFFFFLQKRVSSASGVCGQRWPRWPCWSWSWCPSSCGTSPSRVRIWLLKCGMEPFNRPKKKKVNMGKTLMPTGCCVLVTCRDCRPPEFRRRMGTGGRHGEEEEEEEDGTCGNTLTEGVGWRSVYNSRPTRSAWKFLNVSHRPNVVALVMPS